MYFHLRVHEVLSIIFAVILPNLPIYFNRKIVEHNREWYNTLKKPSHMIPYWVFGPLWLVLYCSIGYASYLVWRDSGGFQGYGQMTLIIYVIQLGLSWSTVTVLFHFHQLKLAAYDFCAAFIMSMVCGCAFYDINPTAGYIFIPYCLVEGYGSYMNYLIYLYNSVNTKTSAVFDVDRKDDSDKIKYILI